MVYWGAKGHKELLQKGKCEKKNITKVMKC